MKTQELPRDFENVGRNTLRINGQRFPNQKSKISRGGEGGAIPSEKPLILTTSSDLTDDGRKTLDFILTPSFSDFDLQPHRLLMYQKVE